jgi:phosphoribosylanthranilate isomerase
MAAAAGAGAIGINFWRGSKRFVGDDPRQVRRVIDKIPAGVLKVGVFVKAGFEEVRRAVDEFGLDRAQLHGQDEAAEDFAGRIWPGGRASSELLICARGVLNDASFVGLGRWEGQVSFFLYDAYTIHFGGEGVQAPWDLIARHAAGNPAQRPFLLAGGLTPDNVGDAIRRVRPDGVDVATGVEVAPGRKDPAKVAAFIQAARAARAAAADVDRDIDTVRKPG